MKVIVAVVIILNAAVLSVVVYQLIQRDSRGDRSQVAKTRLEGQGASEKSRKKLPALNQPQGQPKAEASVQKLAESKLTSDEEITAFKWGSETGATVEVDSNKAIVGVVFDWPCGVDNAHLVPLEGMTELISLSLSGCFRVTTDGLVHLEGLTKLERLNLSFINITDAGLVHLKGLTKLRMLYLYETKITDSGLVHLKGLTNLRSLVLPLAGVTDAGVRALQWALPECKISRRLLLPQAPLQVEVTAQKTGETKPTPPEVIVAIKKLGGKFEVDENNDVVNADLAFNFNTKVTDAGLEHLKGMTKLIFISLHHTKVTDAGLVHLKGLTKLEKLLLNNTKVTDAGLVHLKGLTKLRVLDFGGTRVTDAGLVHLKGLTKLQWLFLQNTRVTDAGVKKFQQALPNCKIER